MMTNKDWKSSKEYRIALATHNAAYRAYDAARTAYRLKQIDDAAFLRARAEYKEATRLYDLAEENYIAPTDTMIRHSIKLARAVKQANVGRFPRSWMTPGTWMSIICSLPADVIDRLTASQIAAVADAMREQYVAGYDLGYREGQD